MNSETKSAPALSMSGQAVQGVRNPAQDTASGKSAQSVEAAKKSSQDIPGNSQGAEAPKKSAQVISGKSAQGTETPKKSAPGTEAPKKSSQDISVSGKSAQGTEAPKKSQGTEAPKKSAPGTEAPKKSSQDISVSGKSTQDIAVPSAQAVSPPTKSGKSAPGTTSKPTQKSALGLILGGVLAVLVLGGATWALVAKLKSKPAKPAVELTAEERELVELTNKSRTENGLPALTVDPALCAVAKAISTERAERGPQYVLNKETLEAQLRAGGYSFETFGLGGINVKSVRPLESTLGKMTIDPHAQKRLLEPAYNEVGIAIHYYAPQGMYYVTQVFAAKGAK